MKNKRISANLPAELLNDAMQITKGGITETLIAGLRLLKRGRAFDKAQALRGKLNLKINLDVSRERNRC